MTREQLFERMTAPAGTSGLDALHYALGFAPIGRPEKYEGAHWIGDDESNSVECAIERVKLLAWERQRLEQVIYDSRARMRFEAACSAMQGLLAARNGFMVDIGTETVGNWAVQCADSLMAALDEKQECAS